MTLSLNSSHVNMSHKLYKFNVLLLALKLSNNENIIKR